MPQPQSYADAL